MGHEEVETVLPADFVPQRDPDPAEEIEASHESEGASDGKKARRKSLMKSWRGARSKSRSKDVSTEESKARTSSGGKARSKFWPLRKADSSASSHATARRSNTTKSKNEAATAEEGRQPEEAGSASGALPVVREGSPANATTSTASSVEIGDENEQALEVESAAKKEAGEGGEKSGEKETGEEASVKSSKSAGSKRSLKSKLLGGKSKEATEGVVDGEKEESNAEEDAPVDAKWVKKVSLSIGGYSTSFQLSDPVANLKEAVDDAMNVVDGIGGDEDLAAQARELDGIGGADDDSTAAEEERDYDDNPTRLFMYLQQRAWGLALNQLQKQPAEARVWVYRRAKPGKAADATEGEQKEEGALVVQQTAIVPHDGSEASKFRWRLLPLHAAIVLGAPTEIIQDIVKAYPGAAKKPDERGSLPVHLAASRLDVDPEGEKVVLQLFGAYPDSIEARDRKGRTPPELAKLARARKEIEDQRKAAAASSQPSQAGVECTESQYDCDAAEKEDDDDSGDDDDDRSVSSVKSSLSGRFQQMLRKSKSTDTVDRRKRNKKKEGSDTNLELAGAKSVDAGEGPADDASIKESLGPGFAFLKTSKSQEVRESTASEEGDEIGDAYQMPENAPNDVEEPQSIPLPMSYAEDDDDKTTYSIKTLAPSVASSKSVKIADTPTTIDEATAASDEAETIRLNEGLRALLEKAVENSGRGGLDVTQFIQVLEEEWVTDVESLRRLDGETLDALLPLMLSRELQRLINHADSIDSQYLKEEKQERGRSLTKKTKKKKKRSTRKVKKRSSPQQTIPLDGPLTTISETEEAETVTTAGDEPASVVTGVRSAPPKLSFPGNEAATSSEEPVEEEEYDQEVPKSASLEDLEIRKLHANLIAEARQKFPTRESLEDTIRARQTEVEAAVNSGFSVDKQTLARAALADDQVRKLLPLRLILPTAADLTEMVGVLQSHKEDAMRDLDLETAQGIQLEIEELQEQIDKEERYVLKKKMGETQCESCGEGFPTETKQSGILKLKEKRCEKCREEEPAAESDRKAVAALDSRDDKEN